MESFDFHPAAREAIDKGAITLLAEIKEHQVKPSNPPDFPSERPVGPHITDKEIIGVPMLFETNIFGNMVARYFPHEGKIYGLAPNEFRNLRRLADQVVKTPWVAEALGREFVEDHIFLWCRDNFQNDSPTSFTEYLSAQAAEEVQQGPVWVPVAFMEVEREFQFVSAKLAPITAAMLDRQERTYIDRSPDNENQIRALFAEKRRKYQGLAAVVLELEAVKGYRMQRAIDLADIIVGLLRLYSAAAYVPWLTCPSAIVGTEYVPSTTAISYGPNGSFAMTQGVLKPLPYPWRISTKEWENMNANHLGLLGDLVRESGLSEFQSRVRTSILTYSKGLTLREVGDRLVYSLSALEGLLLRDSSEPIQQNLGERLAFLLHKDPNERQEIVRNVRDIYGIRSRYIHHQKSVPDESAVEKFFPIARSALFTALASTPNFSTAFDFVNAIDRVKFGG